MNQKGFFTLESLIAFTMFILILMSFQNAFHYSLKAQKLIEFHSNKILETRVMIEKMEEGFSFRVPLKDGKEFFITRKEENVSIRFITEKPISFPPRNIGSRIYLVEFLFSKDNKVPFLTYSEKFLEGYNEFTVQKPFEADYQKSWGIGQILEEISFDGEEKLGWFYKVKKIVISWKSSKSKFLEKVFYLTPFRLVEDEDEG